ncbi:MAG: YdcF family protein [Saprospiraceae bacterium]|nr:YdcF family protein [Saprospiraceae bacterium]
MIDLLKEVVNFSLDPINIIIVLSVLAGLTYYRKKFRCARGLLIAVACIFLATVSNPIPNFLIGNLERKYTPFIDLNMVQQDQLVDILVLGSGHTADPDLPAIGQLSSAALERLTEGVRIYLELPQSRIIFSGYGDESAFSQAEVLKKAAISLGVAEDRVAMQREPSTTAEEASSYLKKFGKQGKLVLVTSAAHMPRAMMLFERVGLKPISAPTGYQIKKDAKERSGWNLFSARNFQKVKSALHEYAGMVWARWAK